jgi:hypothetical protein
MNPASGRLFSQDSVKLGNGVTNRPKISFLVTLGVAEKIEFSSRLLTVTT